MSAAERERFRRWWIERLGLEEAVELARLLAG
jgi:hypothetical protein